MAQSYEDIADMFDEAGKQHERIANALESRNDEYGDQNKLLAEAETKHADTCRRAASVLRNRK